MAGIFDCEADGPPDGGSRDLIGRSWESAELSRLLKRSRLVTVVGLGGAGKSALAADAAHRIARTCAPVVAVDMSGAHGVGQVFQALSRTSGDHETLLVLDNCERLLAASARALGQLLGEATGVTALVTSRRRLGTAGEAVLPLGPLRLDDAVRLLALRARQLGVRLSGGEEERVTAGRICLRLDCLPLAIGLAAGQLTGHTPRELLVRLSDAEASLALSGGPEVPERHRTLRHCHGRSHELCLAQERLLWARLSAFGGTFTRLAAEKVCADEQLPVEAIGHALDGLTAQGLLSRVNHRAELLRMPRTVQDYGAEWLARLGEETRLLERVLLWSRGLL
ncbi:ATP-binding protein [Streptomyces boncukensis]|uniref:AAA+ ATPase domain-containing protein n=1 Tax=Streptomyces boncukensis TaxID=2711219 RepID=A0A6G4WSQ2_9ACTN|nr:hypothetical protein [Streptomyces boncukensis]NGO68138.1 hypothetical protein [Streptomyces boncukensis]